MFYSTPTCYLKALHEANITWPEKSDDFFPYASDPHTYWVGYFTSRPTQKRYERLGNAFLQVCKQVTAMAPNPKQEYESHLNSLREVMGIMQHHDAITGTEKQHVADDYALMMHKALQACESNVRSIVNEMYVEKLDIRNCLYLNISACDVTETSGPILLVSLYNPSGQPKKQFVRVPVKTTNYDVIDSNNNEIEFQLVPIPSSVMSIGERLSSATHEIVFESPDVQPMSFMHIFLVYKFNDAAKSKGILTNWVKKESREAFSIKNDILELNFDTNGFVSGISSEGWSEKFAQNFIWYEGANGNNYVFENRSSGAYIFRPNNTERIIAQRVKVEIVRGPIVQEVHQIFNDWVSQVIRIYKGQSHVEFEWLVGPIPVDDNLGKELVSRFYTTIQSNKTFYTDSNGREMLKRVRSHRDTWELNLVEKEAGNYYPVTAKIAIEDENYRLAVLNDRAQGGSSLLDGVIELMVHRRLLRDDAFGVGEALNETVIARGHHYVFFGRKTTEHPTQEAKERLLQSDIITPVWPFFTNIQHLVDSKGVPDVGRLFQEKTLLKLTLPQNIKLLTFEPWHEAGNPSYTYLIRFEHIFEYGEDPIYSKPVTFNLWDIFGSDAEIRETTLDGNQWLDESERLHFVPDSAVTIEGSEKYQSMKRNESNFYEITMTPMEIRTFLVKCRNNCLKH